MAKLPWFLKETGKREIDERGKLIIEVTVNRYYIFYRKIVLNLKKWL